MIASLRGRDGVVSGIGGKVDSVVEDVVVVLSGGFLESPKFKMPALTTFPVSFALDFRFLASMGDSDLLKAPAVW